MSLKSKSSKSLLILMFIVTTVLVGGVGFLVFSVINGMRQDKEKTEEENARLQSKKSDPLLEPVAEPMEYNAQNIENQPDIPEARPGSVLLLDAAPSYLMSSDLSHPPEIHWHDLLTRELLRQSIWLAGQEELGLTVRDADLGESVPRDTPKVHQLRMIMRNTLTGPQHFRYRIGCYEPGAHAFPRITRMKSETDTLGERLDVLELLTRTELPALLKKLGLNGTRGKISTNTDVPVEVESLLKQIEFAPQFNAVRKLHTIINERGDSPQVLVALVRAYANLGMLTEQLMDRQSYCFKARAVLYAQRLLVREPKNPLAIWARAYAMAIAGHHSESLKDNQLALELAKKQAVVAPAWVSLIEPICKYDAKAFDKTPAMTAMPKFTKLCQFLAQENPSAKLQTGELAVQFLKENPECQRVQESLMSLNELTILRVAAPRTMNFFSNYFPKSLSVVDQIPEGVKAQPFKSLKEEIDLLRRLDEAGQNETNRAGLSWSVLTRFANESRMLQILSRMNLASFVLGDGSSAELFQSMEPQITGHRFETLLRLAIEQSNQKFAKYQKEIMEIDDQNYIARNHLLHRIYDFLPLIERYRKEVKQIVHMGSSPLEWSYLPILDFKDHNMSEIANKLYQRSPYCKIARRMMILYQPALITNEMALWEKESNQSDVLEALGDLATKQKDWSKAVRCYKLAVQNTKESGVLFKLAEAYESAGEDKLAIDTLESCMKLQNIELAHARAQVKISKYYLRQKEYAKAKPYADDAAKSWASWALLNAAAVDIKLKDYDSAEKWLLKNRDRYGDCHSLFFYCHTYQRESLPDATQDLLNSLPKIVEECTQEQTFFMAMKAMLDNDIPKANRFFVQLKNRTPIGDDMHGSHLTLVWLGNLLTGNNKDLITSIEGMKLIPGYAKFMELLLSLNGDVASIPSAERIREILNGLPHRWLMIESLVVALALEHLGQKGAAKKMYSLIVEEGEVCSPTVAVAAHQIRKMDSRK